MIKNKICLFYKEILRNLSALTKNKCQIDEFLRKVYNKTKRKSSENLGMNEDKRWAMKYWNRS